MSRTHGVSAYRNDGCRCDVCREANTARARLERQAMADRLRADPTLAEHGSAATYHNWLCRCGPCTEANAKQSSQRRAANPTGERAAQAERAARHRADPTLAEHGKAGTYSHWGCRCEPCTAANSRRSVAYRATHPRRRQPL